MKPLTRKHSETVKADLQSSKGFRRALLAEAVGSIVEGDVDTGKAVLREYINGTLGFVALGDAIGKSPKSVMRMLSRQGNPQVRNLFEIVLHLQKIEGAVLQVRAVSAAA